MKVSELKQLIKEEIVKALAENESKPTYKSKVDWYYVTDAAHKSGAAVAHDPDYDTPEGEIYIEKGTVGYKDGNEFRDEDDNTVEFKDEYFEKISGGSVNETEGKNKFIDKFKEFIGGEDATSVDIDYFSAQNKLTPEQKSVLKNKFLPNISIKSTGPLSPDINPRFGK